MYYIDEVGEEGWVLVRVGNRLSCEFGLLVLRSFFYFLFLVVLFGDCGC